MTQENVVVVRFAEPDKAHQAFGALKECADSDRIGLMAAAVVERGAAGNLETLEDWDLGPAGTVGGSLIGMLVGVLGGPLGVLLGWGGGALIGSEFDEDRVSDSDEALTLLGTAIPPGSTAVIASVEEPTTDVIDGEMAMLGGEVTRRSLLDVLAELAAAHEAADAAAREARRTVRKKRKNELNGDVEEHLGKLKEKLHVA